MSVALCVTRSSRYTTKYGRADDVTPRREQKDFTHSTKNVFQWKRSFLIIFPPLVEKKYLKTVYQCLARCTQCLDSGDIDGDSELTVLDVDFAIKRLGKL